jgi:hypothetical protein
VTFGGGRVFRQHCSRPDRATDQFAFAVGTNATKDGVGACRTECTLERANSRFRTLRVKVAVAAFAIRFKLQHAILLVVSLNGLFLKKR